MPQAKKKSRQGANARSRETAAGTPAVQPRGTTTGTPAVQPGGTTGDAPAARPQAGSLPAGLRRPPVPDSAKLADTAVLPSTWQSGSARPGAKVTGQRAVKAEAHASGATAAAPPDGAADDVPAWAAKALEEVLMLTYWLDPGEHGDPLTATIRFTGHRRGVTGRPGPGDTFAQEESVSGIMPGSGPVAITAKVSGVTPGEWSVTARPVRRTGDRFRPYPPPDTQTGAEGHVPWPRRVKIPAQPAPTARTTRLAYSKVPGIARFAYSTLVSLGVLVGLALEAMLLHVGHYPAFGALMYSLAAVAAGAVCGKAWYVVVQNGKKFDGWCIQGFVAGAVIVMGAAAVTGTGTPSGALLSAAAPALLIGMSIGRPGCFWAGCCTGRPTAARWGVWSSDRRLGCRREPAQLLEALSALIIGAAVLCVVLLAGFERSGPMAVAGLAAYTFVRQFIIGMRAEPRRWRYGRRVTAAAAAVALVASLILFALG